MVEVSVRSLLTGKEGSMTLNLSPEEYFPRLALWRSGTLIQDAFPMLSADEREFLMTGALPGEFDALFAEDE